MTSTRADSARAGAPPAPTIEASGEGDHHCLSGALVIQTLGAARQSLSSWSARGASCTLDIAGIERLDTPGALFLCALRDKGIKLAGVRPEHQSLLDLIDTLELKPLVNVPPVAGWRQLVIDLGKSTYDARQEALAVVTFTGRVVHWTVAALLHPASLRPASISRHIRETGIQALPIIGLMAVMIAMITRAM